MELLFGISEMTQGGGKSMDAVEALLKRRTMLRKQMSAAYYIVVLLLLTPWMWKGLFIIYLAW